MKLWELIKKGAEEGLEVLKDGVSIAGKTSRILRKRVELTSVQGEVRSLFTRLGSSAYEFQSKSELGFYQDEAVKGVMAQIEVLKNRVREIENEMETIKAEERRKPEGKTSEVQDQHPPI